MDEFDHIPSSPPDSHEWEYRRRKYDFIWMSCINPNGSTTNDHADGLQLELERSFCSGCWVACIMLSAAIVEVHLSFLDRWKRAEAKIATKELNITEEWEWLRERRNMLVHGKVGSEESRLSATEYRYGRDSLQREAQRAVRVALQVSLNNPEAS